MVNEILWLLERIDNCLWGYFAVPGLLFLGAWLSIKSRFIQIREFPTVLKTFISFLKKGGKDHNGVHPLKVFSACICGSTGISNLVAVCTAVQIGGPGALLWLWIAAFSGMVLKYSEVYLGMRYRVANSQGGWHGGPMYYLNIAFKSKWIPKLVCVLLCIYGVDIYQFSVVTASAESLLPLNKQVIAGIIILLIISLGRKGLRSIGWLSGMLVPVFLVCYLSMGAWIFFKNMDLMPSIIQAVFSSAFNGHAAAGAFAGSGIVLTMSSGIRRGCYSGDVGIGYASVIHSQTGEIKPEKQASLAIFDIFLDSFVICTTSLLLVMVTGVWNEPMDASLLIQSALSKYFPYMDFFIPLFLLFLGYTTIVVYFSAGLKCAEFLQPKFGKLAYYGYAGAILFAFSFIDTSEALIVMSTMGAILLLLNLAGIYRLRHHIDFQIMDRSSYMMTGAIDLPIAIAPQPAEKIA